MSKNPETITVRNDSLVRLASRLGAFTCVLGGLLLALSTGASLFRWTFINSGPGDLLFGAYGMFAFIIPLYLFWAAWIILNPGYKPGRIFILSTIIVPFLTLALGFSLIRDFEIYRQKWVFFEL